MNYDALRIEKNHSLLNVASFKIVHLFYNFIINRWSVKESVPRCRIFAFSFSTGAFGPQLLEATMQKTVFKLVVT